MVIVRFRRSAIDICVISSVEYGSAEIASSYALAIVIVIPVGITSQYVTVSVRRVATMGSMFFSRMITTAVTRVIIRRERGHSEAQAHDQGQNHREKTTEILKFLHMKILPFFALYGCKVSGGRTSVARRNMTRLSFLTLRRRPFGRVADLQQPG